MRIYHLVEAESLWALSQRGSVNLPQVRELQDRLRAAGHDPGPSDGWYGQRTADAVRAYQQANNLVVDGDAGPQTLARLGMAGAQTTPAQPTPPAETPPAPAPRQPAREPATTTSAPTRNTPSRSEPSTTAREPASTSTTSEPATRPDEDEVADNSLSELVQRISRLDAPETALYIGRFDDETGATYYFAKVKMSENNSDVVIYLGGRRSAAPDEFLQRQGIPRDSFSIYGFSLTENVGYNIIGRTNHDSLEDGLSAFENAEISNRSYPLNQGSTQFMRRAHIMRVLRNNPIISQNESIQRLASLAGL